MFFSTEYWPITLLWALISAFASFGLIAYSGKEGKRGMLAFASSFVVALLLERLLMYYVQPAFQGSFFGYFEVLFCAVVPAVAFGLIFSEGRCWLPSILAVLVLLGVPTVQYTSNAWGGANLRRHAEIPNIRVAAQDATIPPTDADHMVLVIKSIA